MMALLALGLPIDVAYAQRGVEAIVARHRANVHTHLNQSIVLTSRALAIVEQTVDAAEARRAHGIATEAYLELNRARGNAATVQLRRSIPDPMVDLVIKIVDEARQTMRTALTRTGQIWSFETGKEQRAAEAANLYRQALRTSQRALEFSRL